MKAVLRVEFQPDVGFVAPIDGEHCRLKGPVRGRFVWEKPPPPPRFKLPRRVTDNSNR